MLRDRLAATGFEVVNAGVNGDTSTGVLARLDQVIACRPDAVTVLIGTNDVLEGIGREDALPAYRANVTKIVQRLRDETSARIAVLSPPPFGGVLDNDHNRPSSRSPASNRSATCR
jgi:lysophospholipase L1-like esterase